MYHSILNIINNMKKLIIILLLAASISSSAQHSITIPGCVSIGNSPPTGVNYAQYSDRVEPAYTSFSNYESVPAGADNLINIHANNGPYAGGTGDIIIENRHIQQTNATGSIIWAYMPKSYGRKVIIRNCVFASSSAWDFIYASDDTEIEIYNCRFYGTSPLGTSKPRSIYGYRPYSVKVTNCYFEQTGGGVAINGWSAVTGGTLQVQLNKIKNIDGIGASDFRQFMTVQHVEEVPNQLIEWNQVINLPDFSRVEDNINIGSSSGTSASPLTIQNNYIQGAYPYPAASGNFSGTGMTTDATDANAPMIGLPHNIHATKNQWINTLNAGMNIAAGYNVLYDDNDIVSSASLPNGTALAGSSNGVAIFRGQPYPNDRFFNNQIINNRINFKPSAYYRSESLTEGNTLNTYATNATYADEVQQYNNWKQKLNTNQKRIGALD